MHTQRNTYRGRRAQGFSLIELLVVITIIGILAGIVGVNVFTAMREANVTSTKTQMRSIEDAIAQYKLKKRKLPDSLDELVPDFLNSETVPKDAWGNEFYYSREGTKDYQLVSYGADGTDGGEDEDADIDRKSLRSTGDEEQ